MSVSSEARPARAKATPVSRERFTMPVGGGGAEPHISDQAPLVWRAPEGPDGERAGHRPRAHQAARPNESGPTAPRTPAEPQATSSIANSDCGSHGQRQGLDGTTQHRRHRRCGGRRRDRRTRLRRPWAVAGPGRASRRRAERSSRRGRLAGGPPPTGAQSSPVRRVRPDDAQNTSRAASTTGAQANRPYSPPPPGSGRPV